MFRKTALAMAMLGTLTTGSVVALGLGEIDLKSSLNQPLNAEVELLSATEAEMEEIKVAIGSSEAFANAGVERPVFLTKLKFDVTTTADGRPVVAITSREAVREPFLDFLLEISWSKGRLLREYTVLVDPPLTMPAPAPGLAAPAARASGPAAAPQQQARRVGHTAQMPPVSVAAGEGEYGPVRRNDTLWGIAQQVRPDAGVSIEQTMLGLLRANPEAFVNNNINNLKEGYVLRIPSREDMTSISRTEASREARAQYTAWREARGLLAPAPAQGTPQASTADASGGSHLQLVAPDMAEGGATTGGAASADLDQLQSELLMANEALEEQRRQGEDMSSRLSVLEEQIVNMQRLIQLKDDELARLQAQAGDASGEAVAETDLSEALAAADETAEAAVTDVTEAAADMEVATGEELATAEQIGFETVLDDEAATDTLEPLADGVDTAGTLGAEPVELPFEEEQVALAPQPEPEPVAVAAPETATPQGFVDRLLANPLWLGAGAAVLALLAFVGLRRKRGVETEFQESILQATQSGSAPESDSEIVASEPESTQSASSESSLLSEFAVSDMGSIKNDGEADPLAEADVYLAYGRFQQAEDLIKDALKNDAQREDLNLKLLEVYMAGKNQSAFDGHAQAVLAGLENGADPMWEKVAEMGRELSPNNPLYQEGGAAQQAGADTAADSLSDDLDFSMDEAAAEPEDFSPAAEAADDIENLEQGLDFDLDLSFDAGESGKEVNEDQPDSAEVAPLEDLAAEPEPPEQEPDIGMDSVEPDALGQDNAMDFDLEGFELDSDVEAEAELQGDGELADLDEVSTKLDLARAYIDMGDPDGAKSILDEVMDEGSDTQKDEARGIMAQMS